MGCESSSPSNSQPPREAAIRLCIQRLHLVIVANHSSRSAKAFDDACCTELHNIISLAERYPMGHLFTEIYSEIVQLRREHPDNLMSDNLRFLICMTLKVFNPENTTTYSIHEDKPFQVEPQVVSTVCKEESVAEDDLMATADAEVGCFLPVVASIDS